VTVSIAMPSSASAMGSALSVLVLARSSAFRPVMPYDCDASRRLTILVSARRRMPVADGDHLIFRPSRRTAGKAGSAHVFSPR